MEAREAFEKLVSVARTAKQNDDKLMELGYTYTPYFEIYGKVMDAIWYLLGENTETLSESITYNAVNYEGYTDEERVDLLMDKFKKQISDKIGGEK